MTDYEQAAEEFAYASDGQHEYINTDRYEGFIEGCEFASSPLLEQIEKLKERIDQRNKVAEIMLERGVAAEGKLEDEIILAWNAGADYNADILTSTAQNKPSTSKEYLETRRSELKNMDDIKNLKEQLASADKLATNRTVEEMKGMIKKYFGGGLTGMIRGNTEEQILSELDKLKKEIPILELEKKIVESKLELL